MSTFLDNLGRAAPEYTDADAQAMIRKAVADEPDAAHPLVRHALLQEMALRNAQAQIADLRAQLREARGSGSAGSPGGFPGGAGSAGPSQERGWTNAPGPSSEPPAASGRDWAQATPAQSPTAGQGFLGRGGLSGFLSSAAATAAGVAGGAMLFQGPEHLLGGSGLSGFGSGLGTRAPTVEETVINEYGSEPAADDNRQDWGENYADAPDAGQDLPSSLTRRRPGYRHSTPPAGTPAHAPDSARDAPRVAAQPSPGGCRNRFRAPEPVLSFRPNQRNLESSAIRNCLSFTAEPSTFPVRCDDGKALPKRPGQ